MAQLNLVKSQLESQFGKALYQEVYKIIKNNSQSQTFSYDLLSLTKLIYTELLGKYKKNELNDASNKIPEFYSLVFAEGKMLK